MITERLYSEIEKVSRVKVAEFSRRRMLLCRYDLLHIHWPDLVLMDKVWLRSAAKVLLLLLALVWIRLWGKRVVWTAHNLVSHEQYHRKLERLFWRLLIPLLDGIICLSCDSLEKLHSYHKAARGIPSLVVSQGTYRGVYPNTVSRAAARDWLNLKAGSEVVLNLGSVRRYKRVERLIELAREAPELCVVIAGRVHEADYEAELRAQAQGRPNVHLFFQFIPDRELQYYLNASDLFLLPCDEITNSGSALLSLSFGLPVLSPELPCFRSLQRKFGGPWVSTYRGDLNAGTVRDCLRKVREELKTSGRSARLGGGEDYEWENIALKSSRFFESLLRRRGVR